MVAIAALPPVRPAEQSDPVDDHVRPRSQISERAVGVERPDGHLVELAGTGLVAAPRETLRIAARAEAIDQESEIALLGPHATPHLMTLR